MFTYTKDANLSGGLGSSAAVAQIVLAQGCGNSGATLGGGCDFDLSIFNPSGTTQRKRLAGILNYLDTNGIALLENIGGTYRGTTNAVNGLRVMYSSGTIASGTFKLYGVQ